MKEKFMAFLRFLISPMFLLNLLGVILVSFGVLYFLLDYMHDYTLQDEEHHREVGWYYGMPVGDAVVDIEKKGLAAEVDSVFIQGIEPGTVVKQDPYPTDSGGTKVKPGRIISLKVQAVIPPGKEIPDVIEKSRRIAETKLRSRQLKPKIQFKPHDKTYVLDLLVNGKSVQPGTKVPIGTAVTVVVGKGKAQAVEVPVLSGLTISEARIRLSSASLVLLPIECAGCETPEDSANAVIVSQNPMGGENSTASSGSEVSVWFAKSESENQE